MWNYVDPIIVSCYILSRHIIDSFDYMIRSERISSLVDIVVVLLLLFFIVLSRYRIMDWAKELLFFVLAFQAIALIAWFVMLRREMKEEKKKKIH